MKKWACGILFLAVVITGCGGQGAEAAGAAGAAVEDTAVQEVVSWEFKPLTSSLYPAFPFRFDLPYERIEAACDAGQLIGFDDHDGTEYPTGKTLTMPEGSRLYWSPWDGAEVSLETEIAFTAYAEDGKEYSGCITIKGSRKAQEGEENGDFVEAAYLAVLDEQDELWMAADEESAGARIVLR